MIFVGGVISIIRHMLVSMITLKKRKTLFSIVIKIIISNVIKYIIVIIYQNKKNKIGTYEKLN